jgi:tetrahydromethanopterin S-methyltransferase subunit D
MVVKPGAVGAAVVLIVALAIGAVIAVRGVGARAALAGNE